MQYKVNINGIDVDAIYSKENIDEIFIPMLERMKQLHQEHGRRILVFLAAPPGTGKSTLVSFLQYLSENTDGLEPVATIGMDGFHHYQDYLKSHQIIRDGKEYSMVQVKGAPETFDLDQFTERIKRVASGEKVGWPEYNRMTHNPKDNAIYVTGDIVLLEGNYLLLNRKGWKDLRNYADLTIKITAEPDMLRNRLIERKICSGSIYEDAAQFVDFSDMANVRVCLEESADADINLELCQDDSYKIRKI